MAVTTEDVQEWVKAKWASASLTPALILGRVNQEAASPYTSMRVVDNEPQRTATGGYLQTFTLELKTWDETGAADAGTIKVAIEAAFNVQTRTTATLSSGRSFTLLHSVKAPGGSLDDDDATRQGKAVKLSTDRFELLCVG